MQRFDIFRQRDGRTIRTTRFRIIARLFCRFSRQLDFAPMGQGWLK